MNCFDADSEVVYFPEKLNEKSMTKFPIKLSKNSASFLVMSCNGNGIQLFEYPWELIQKFCHSCDKAIEKANLKAKKFIL